MGDRPHEEINISGTTVSTWLSVEPRLLFSRGDVIQSACMFHLICWDIFLMSKGC